MNVEINYRRKIDDLWLRYEKLLSNKEIGSVISLGYRVERTIKEDDILFIGMNPSYKEGDWNNSETPFYDIAPKNKYFSGLISFTKETISSEHPSHHDLFFIRHKTQKDVEKWYKKNEYKSFFEEQLRLSKEIIVNARPRMVVVINARACNHFRQMFSVTEGDFDEKTGVYMVEINKPVPVLFSGMLSGQRVIDNGTKRTLRWHINRVLESFPIEVKQ